MPRPQFEGDVAESGPVDVGIPQFCMVARPQPWTESRQGVARTNPGIRDQQSKRIVAVQRTRNSIVFARANLAADPL